MELFLASRCAILAVLRVLGVSTVKFSSVGVAMDSNASKSQVMRMSEILLLFQVCGAVRAFVTVGVRTAPCRHTRAWVPAGNRGFQALSVGCRVRNETCHV